MRNGNKGKAIGIAGLSALFASWLAISVGPHVLAPQWVPQIWLVTTAIALPCATLAGIFAALRTSRWWYVLAGASLISAALLLVSAAG
jgi:hypothetical protein